VSSVRSGAARGALALAGVILLGLAYAYGGRLLGDGARSAVSVTGTIEATQVDVSVKVTGRIVARLVNEGDRVSDGQVLVRLEGSELEAEVHRQEAAVRTTEAALRDLLAGARPEEIKEGRATVARAHAQLDDLLAGARAQEIEDARAAVRSTEATRQMRERELG